MLIENLPYVVIREFRFSGRGWVVGQAFEPWRLSVSRGDVQSLLDDGYIKRKIDEADEPNEEA